MPHSLILNLQPRSPIYPNFLSGKHLHALFLTLVSSVDQELGDRLHEQKTEKAFTLSPLQVGGRVDEWMGKGVDTLMRHGVKRVMNASSNYNTPSKKTTSLDPSTHPPIHSSPHPPIHSSTPYLQWQHNQPIPAGTPCWWRISLLDDSLFSHLTPLWLNLNPSQPWHLGSADLVITSVLGTPRSTQPWANFSSYTQLYEQASDDTRQVTFAFCTPATFRQGKYDSALPTRDCVFNSVLNRWNRYSGIPFPETIIESLFPSFFDIQTELVNHPEGKWAGCVGTVSYRILGDVDTGTIRQLNALADFALYSGVGRKTPMGMGMVRRLMGR
ncbi:MAG: CRISPR-associated endoribonuclease Cas6 [Cyanobacteria bacterium CRU_2_1]|nr:CRISPR-associated endoribonuclease Cas6 [Cyanobacteria bacterium CRU_2_1]